MCGINDDMVCCGKMVIQDYLSDLDHITLRFCENCERLSGKCSKCYKNSTFSLEIKTDKITFEYSVAICDLCNEVSGFYHHWNKSQDHVERTSL